MKTIDPRTCPPPVDWGVEVEREHVDAAVQNWRGRDFPEPEFGYPGPPDGLSDGPWFDYSVLTVSVLACLWPPRSSEMWSVSYRGNRLTDAPALFAAFTKWMGGAPRLDVGSFVGLTASEACRLFSGRGVLQLVRERGARLADVAAALSQRWEGEAVNLVEEGGWDGPRVVELLASTIPGYEDEARLPGYHLRFRKLAHLAAAFMASRSSRPWTGMDSFPVYPDYMLPRVLRHLGILHYAPALAKAIDSLTEIPRHSRPEVAIRWATVRAGHLLVEGLAQAGAAVTAPRLDYFLWSEAVLGPDAGKMGRHHRTVTLDY